MRSPHLDSRRNIEINLGKACNNRCVFCVDGDPGPEQRRYLPFEVLQSELRRWVEQGFRSVGLLGGEPTTYPRLAAAIAEARVLGFERIAIATNATRLARADFADSLLDAGLTRVTVSMHGHTAAIEDALTGVPGNFDKKRRALRHLVARRREGALKDGLSVNIVVVAQNYRHLPALLRFFFEDIGVDDVRANFVRPAGRVRPEHVPRFAQVVPWLTRAIVLNERRFHRVFTFGGLPWCVLPRPLLADSALLNRTMGESRDLSTACSVHDQGTPDQRARFDWQRRKRDDLKRHPVRCEGCAAYDLCEGVWTGYLDLYGPDDLRPLAPGELPAQ